MKTLLEIFLDGCAGVDVKIEKPLNNKENRYTVSLYDCMGKILSRSDQNLVKAQMKAFYSAMDDLSKEEKKYFRNKLKEAAEFHECLILVGPCR